MAAIRAASLYNFTPFLSTSTHLTHCNTLSLTIRPNRHPGLTNAHQNPAPGGGSEEDIVITGIDVEGDGRVNEKSVADYFDQTAVLMESLSSYQGPRWFSPVECGVPRLNRVPLLLYLPGIDGVGLGLVKHHEKLGKIFEVRCLHIPPMDRTSFAELVKLVDGVVKSEHNRSPSRPIYLVGDSIGACLALSVASLNVDVDLVLILVNPATSFSRSSLQLLVSLVVSSPVQSLLSVSPFSLVTGDPMRVFVDAVEKVLGHSRASKDLLQSVSSLSSYYSVIAGLFPGNTFLWKMEMLQSACAYANSRLHAIKAQSLVLLSGKDPFLPSQDEGERLRKLLTKCEIRKFDGNGHFLLLEDGVDLVDILKATNYYRRRRHFDYVKDFLPPTPSEFKKRVQDPYWWYDPVFSPVMLSTLADGTIVKGLEGIPSDGPTLLVGNHMLLAFEVVPLVMRILTEKNILVRVMSHPMMFYRQGEGQFPEVSSYDMVRLMGGVPVSGANLFKLLSSKSHVLLYPGGMREALHRKNEEYQLFWPKQSEFVRMAARFGAKIVPFGAVGEDDVGKVVVDYNDLNRIPYIRAVMKQLTSEARTLRDESDGEVSNQQMHLPGILPQIPGRLYFLFGKPIEATERKDELKDREKPQEMYSEVKSEVEKCLAYLKEKRDDDPYRTLMSRLIYMATHDGLSSDIPTFEL